MSTWRFELLGALRSLSRRRVLTIAAATTLAIGVGINGAMFSIVESLLLSPLPFPADSPDRVVVIAERNPPRDKSEPGRMSVSYPTFRDWLTMARSFETIAGFRNTSVTWQRAGGAERVQQRQISASYFELMGVQPLIGRPFTAREDGPGAGRVVLLGEGLWRESFGGFADVAGQTMRLDGEVHEIIGVLPAELAPGDDSIVYVPVEPWALSNEYSRDRGNHMGLYALARLREGVSVDQARQEMQAIAVELERIHPRSNAGVRAAVDPILDLEVREYRQTVWLLFAAVVLVLLIACANVTSLLLARTADETSTSALCTALGASRASIIRQSMFACSAIAVMGTLAGIVLAYVGFHAIRTRVPFDLPRLATADFDPRALAYTMAVGLAMGLVCGLVPAWRATRAPATVLRATRSSADPGRSRVTRLLVIGEFALATVLGVGAGLLVRTGAALAGVDPGFTVDRLLAIQLTMTGTDPDQYRAVYGRVREAVAAIPGVIHVSHALSLPLRDSSWTSIFILGDLPVPPRSQLPFASFNPVDLGYFETMGITLVEGRTFTRSDTRDSQRVIVVNERLATRLWPGQSAVGKMLKQGWPESEGEDFPWREIIGVVRDTKQQALDQEAGMEVYLPFTQNPRGYQQLVVRTDGDPRALSRTVLQEVRRVVPELAAFEAVTMREQLDELIAPQRFMATTLALFATVALLLAATGVYGTLAHSVAQRRQEMAIRIAMGADNQTVFGQVMWEGLISTVIGLVAGLAGATIAARALETLLFGVTRFDPASHLIAPVLLVVVATVACAVPAWRAARTDPLLLLKAE